MEELLMTLRPMADNVLLKQNEANETSVGGIILATATKIGRASCRERV